MSEEIFFNGVKYISAADAAEICSLSRDYVARLAREKKILGRQLGRNWYVNEDSLKEFLIGNEYQSILRRNELIRERKEEYKAQAAAQASAVTSLARSAIDVHRKVTSVAVNGTAQLASTANSMLADASSHLPYYAVSPGLELLHRVASAVLVIFFFVGVYATGDALIKTSPNYARGTTITPSREIATVGDLTSGTFASIFETMQRGVYAFLAPFWGTQNTPSQPIVAVQITSQQSAPRILPAAPTQTTLTPVSHVGAVQSKSEVTTRTVVQQPIIQKIYETQPLAVAGGVSEEELITRLQQLDNKLSSQIYSTTAANSTVTAQNYDVTAQTNAINQLSGVKISDASISGGSISGASISGTSLSLGSPLDQSSGGTGISSYNPGDIVYANASGTLTRLGIGGSGQVLKISRGLPGWGVDLTGSGGASAWATSTNGQIVYTTDPTNIIVIGASATTTTGNILEVAGNALLDGALVTYGTTTAPAFVATSTATSTFAGGISAAAFSATGSATSTFANGINVTSGCFSVNGTCITAGGGGSSNVSTSSANTWSALQLFAGNASSSNFSNFGTAYFGGTATSSFNSAGELTLAGVTNALLATDNSGKVVATTSIGVSNLTGTLGVANGGTGSTTLSGILTGNGTGAVTSAILASPLLFSGNTLSIQQANSSQNGFLASSDWTTFNGKVSSSSLSATYPLAYNSSTGVFSLGFGTTTSNTWAGTQTFGNSSTTLGTVSTLWLPSIANAILSTDQNGKVAATTTISTGLLSADTIGLANGGGLTVSGFPVALGGSGTISLDLAHANTWTGLQSFQNASSTIFSVGNGSATTTLLGQATSTFGAGIQTTALSITGSGTTTASNGFNITAGCFSVNGTCITGSGGGAVSSVSNSDGTLTISPTSGAVVASLNLAHGNWWTGTQNFTNASTSQFTATSSVFFTALTNALLGTDQNGKLVSTTTIGTNLLSANTISLTNGGGLTVSGSPIALGGSGSLALDTTHANTWTGFQSFQNASSTQLSVFAKAYFGGTATTTISSNGNVAVGGVLSLGTVTSCTGGQALQTDGSGNISCGAITVSGASSGGGWTTNNSGRVSLSTSTDLAVIGASTTPYAKLSVISGANATTTLALVPSSAQTANIIDLYAPGGGLNSVFTANDWLGIGTTSPAAALSVAGNGYFTGGLGVGLLNTTAGTLQTSGSATIGGTLTVNGTGTSTFSGNMLVSGNIVPGADNTYTLGLASTTWKSVYIGPGSLFVNGQEVIHTDASQNVILSSNINENLEMQTSGSANVILNPTGSGQIQLQGPVQVTGGKNITTSDSSALPIPFGVAGGNLTISGNAITATNLNGGISLMPNGNGGTYITNGNVGIGTTNPGSKLEVQGVASAQSFNATSTTATSTFADGISLTGGCVSVNGTCLTGGVSSVSNSDGTLTISPTSGAVVASLALAHANNWTGLQQFANATSTLFTAGTLWDTSVTGSLLKTDAAGKFIAATAGTDYQAPITAGYPILFSANNLSLAFGTTTANSWSALQQFNGGASTTNITASGEGYFATASTTNLIVSGSPSGILQTNSSGAVSAGQVALGSQVSGILPVSNGGTGWANISANTLLTGNGTGALATTSIGTGLSLSGGTLSNAGVTSANQTYGTAQTGAITFATSSAVSFNGLTLSHTIINAGGTFTFANALSGTLNNSGLTNSTISGVALGSNLFSLSHDSTLSGGPYNGSATVSNWGLNLANANSWTGLQTFAAGASTTNISASGEGYFATASTTNLLISGTPSAILSTNASGQVGAVAVGASLAFSGNTLSLNTANPNTWSALQTFGNGYVAQASSTVVGNFTSTGAGTFGNGLSVSGATSTFANGLTLSSGCVFYNGSCIGANSGTVNSGTQGQLPYYATNGTTLSATSSLFLTTAGYFGVGTSTPGIVSGASRYLSLATPGSGEQTAAFEFAGNSNTVNGVLGRISFLNQTGWTENARISTAIGNDTSDGNLIFSTDHFGVLSEAMRINQAQYVGIGTTSPGSILSIGNVANFTTATTTFYSSGGINLAGGCFSLNGTCLTSLSSLTTTYPIQFSGNNLSLAFGTTTANTWSALQTFNGGLTAFASSTIGNGTQAGGLTINGGATTTADMHVNGKVYVGSLGSYISDGGTGNFVLAPQSGTTMLGWGHTFQIPNNSGVTALNITGGTGANYFNGGGNFGIGTTTPGTILSIGNTGANTINISNTSTSTFGTGINLTSGCFSVGGTCVGGGSSGSGGGQLLATYATSSPGSNISVSFTGAAGSQPSFSGSTLTLPSNTSYFVVDVWGGGGGGGGSGATSPYQYVGGGGGGGGYSKKLITNPSGTYYYSIGAGGLAGSAGSNGGAGGTSCFGTNSTACTSPTLSATGGSYGTYQGGGTSGFGGAGGTGSGGDVNMAGGAGDNGEIMNLYSSVNVTGGSGGSAPAGGGGGAAGNGAAGSAGGAFGGGGGGAGVDTTGQAGGAGGAGGIAISVYTTGISNGSVGSGTQGQFAFYSAAGTNLSATSSIFASAAGSIGIGTTTPWANLSVTSLSQQSGLTPLLSVASTTGAHLFDVLGNGNVGIGTTSPASTFSVVGNGYFTSGLGAGVLNTAAGTLQTSGNATIGGNIYDNGVAANSLLYNNASQQLAAASIGSSLSLSSGTLSLNTANANTWTGLQQFQNASTTVFSAYGPAYFGATATSSFASNGALSLVSGGLTVGGSQLVVSGRNVGIGTNTPVNPNGAYTGLQVYGSSGYPTIDVQSVDSAGGAFFEQDNNASASLLFGTYGSTNSLGAIFGVARPNNSFVYTASGGALSLGTWGPQNITFGTNNTANVTIQSGGNVGIGTSTPGSLLSLNNIANFTAATSTFYSSGGINLTGGCFSMNGTCITGGSGASLSSQNTWTALQIFSAGASTTQLSVFNKAYFGGTATSTFDSTGALTLAGSLTLNNGAITYGANSTSTIPNNTAFAWTLATSTTASPLFRIDSTTGSESVTIGASGSDVYIGDTGVSPNLVFQNSGQTIKTASGGLLNIGAGTDKIAFGGSGGVGVGTTSPLVALHIAGSSTNTTSILLDNSTGGTNVKRARLYSNAGYFTVDAPNDSFSGVGSALFDMNLSNGNVGIGTTTPGYGLSLQGSLLVGGGAANAGSALETAAVHVDFTGAGTEYGMDFAPVTDTTTDINFYNAAHTSVGSITETSSATAYNTTSDRRVKENIATTTLGLPQLMELPVRNFDFLSDSAHATTTGFIAQELYQVFPWAVTTNGDNGIVPLGPTSTPWSVDYGRITPLIVSSVQNLNDVFNATGATTSAPTILSLFQGTTTPVQIDALGNLSIGTSTAATTTDLELCLNGSCITEFPYSYPATSSASSKQTMTLSQNFLAAIESALSQWFASATNGVQSFFASVIHANEVDTGKLCVSDSNGSQTCVTKSQLDALLAGAAAGTATSASTASTTAPILQVNGNNPATIDIGATYNDLGATITGPTADLNLGVEASVDGATSTAIADIHIDTSKAGTHAIVYSAIDQNGVTGSAVRTVVVVDPNATSTTTTTSSTAPTTSTSTTTSSPSTSTSTTSTTTSSTTSASTSSATSSSPTTATPAPTTNASSTPTT